MSDSLTTTINIIEQQTAVATGEWVYQLQQRIAGLEYNEKIFRDLADTQKEINDKQAEEIDRLKDKVRKLQTCVKLCELGDKQIEKERDEYRDEIDRLRGMLLTKKQRDHLYIDDWAKRDEQMAITGKLDQQATENGES